MRNILRSLVNTAYYCRRAKNATADNAIWQYNMIYCCYVDADFAGLWNSEDNLDPRQVVQLYTGYVICIGGLTIIWSSVLQSEIAISTPGRGRLHTKGYYLS